MDQDAVAEDERLAHGTVQRIVEQEGGVQEAAGGGVAVEGRWMANVRGMVQKADAGREIGTPLQTAGEVAPGGALAAHPLPLAVRRQEAGLVEAARAPQDEPAVAAPSGR